MNQETSSPDPLAELDAGDYLPGCSLPVWTAGDANDVHAFREFEPLVLDGLNDAAKRAVVHSLPAVIESLQRLHDRGFCYGRIASSSMHNRGTKAVPAATLWVERDKVRQAGAVHAGDAESMYWTDTRLQSAAAATPADDWYALGIVCAEIQLSSASVHKIWELSRQDGDFVPSLLKNLKRSRGQRSLKQLAATLIGFGVSGQSDRSSLQKRTSRLTRDRSFAPLLLAGLIGGALALAGWSFARDRDQDQTRDEKLTRLAEQVDQLQARAEQLRLERDRATEASLAPAPAVPAAEQRDDRFRWAEAAGGRPLEEAIELAAQFEDPRWSQRLQQLAGASGQKQWRQHDPQVRRLLQQAVDAPWDEAAARTVLERYAALNQAYERWLAWARSGRTIEEVKTQHQLMASGIAKESLGQWLAEALEVHDFKLTVVNASEKQEDGWVAHLVGFETPDDSQSKPWRWEAPEGRRDTLALDVSDYQSGDPLKFWLQRDSAVPFWNTTVIEHSFDSPLLVWLLSRGLKLDSEAYGTTVFLTADKHFGPPTRLQQSGGASAAVSQRKVVDPLDDLPFDLE